MSQSARTTWMRLIAVTVMAGLLPAVALAVPKIGDITHLQGARVNKLTGFGIVTGLNGTGDGGKNALAMRALAAAYERLGAPVLTLDELKTSKNVAIVIVEATLPRDGAREGEQIDVQLSSTGAAKSLLGGRLLPTPLVSLDPQDGSIMAMAGGALHIDDLETPTVANIPNGATLEQSWIHNYVALGRDLEVYKRRSPVQPLDWILPSEHYVTFVIDGPTSEWAVADTIAKAINDSQEIDSVWSREKHDGAAGAGQASETAANKADSNQIAMALDPRTVIVRIPAVERANPASFLTRIEGIPLFMPETEARVTINRRVGSIVMTGDVEIAPGIISYKGLTITALVPAPEPGNDRPRLVEQNFFAVDPQRKATAKLTNLLEALNQLQVSVDDRINIIGELKKNGQLYATVYEEN